MTTQSRITGTASRAARDQNADAPWEPGVTARIVTRYGIYFNDPQATVDIHDYRNGTADWSQARCGGCGDHSLERFTTLRNTEILDWARKHAGRCMAMPRPTTTAQPSTAA